MSSFTRLLLEKGINISEAPGALPHRSRQSSAYPASAQAAPALSLDAILAQLDEEDATVVPVEATVPKSRSRQEQESRPEKTPARPSRPSRPYYYDPHFSEASSAAQRRSEAFENIPNRSLREDAQTISRQKPRSAETRKPSHWNFSFNVNREVVGAELLEMGEDGELQPPAQDPKNLPRTGKGRAEPLPGLPGLRQGPLRTEPGLARFRPIPGHNEWVAGLQKMAEANRPKDVAPKPSVPAEEFLERGSPLEKRPFRCLRSEVVLCSVDCLCDDWKY